MMEPRVFYAWQSDTPPDGNRYFIRDALRHAVRLVSNDMTMEESPRIDYDTKDVPGTPEIASTIFTKISASGAFVADLTLVGATPGGKRTPNANVLLETGFAAAQLGWERIIGVMNVVLGNPDEQIFDLRSRRFPLAFRAAPDSSPDFLAEEKRKLTDSLRQALTLCLRQHYEAVERAVQRMDGASLLLVAKHADKSFIPHSVPQTMGQMLSAQSVERAFGRLIDLGVLRARIEPTNTFHGYEFTYLGRKVVERIMNVASQLKSSP